MNGPEPQPSARLRVRHGLGDARRPITLVEVEGDHDVASGGPLISTLEGVGGHLVVDLTRCGFIDKGVISAILGKALDLERRGYRFELVVPPSGPLSRTVDVLGLRDVVWMRDELHDRGLHES